MSLLSSPTRAGACCKHPSPSFEKSMGCAKNHSLPQCHSTNAAAVVLFTRVGGNSCSVGRAALGWPRVDVAPSSPGECPALGYSPGAGQELQGTQPWAIGIFENEADSGA